MEIIERARTFYARAEIRIENWNGASNDWFPKNSTVICYPRSKETVVGIWKNPLIKKHRLFQYELQFNNAQEAKEAFENLVTGRKRLIDYIENYHGTLSKKIIAKCLGYEYPAIILTSMMSLDEFWDEEQ